ncbi:STE20/SPS1-related proline-alanine-rich protein kinase isoform X2 [Oryza brachyantha]|uniref:Protein kinase domain-containing protein n=1 Tax=Oryza brachyantha TaxID=4533 RepID=J3N455_ORYBR|nr:STE20/SPS1-related proline-alanine-rich protein kinase isoform X2 [Oryza brachyantha]
MGRNGSVKRTSSSSASAAAVPSFTANPRDYQLREEVGYGAHAVVYRAVFVPRNEVVAVKCLDLDQLNNNIDEIQREAQIMSLIEHPNVIRAYCSFVVEHSLWVVMPFMTEGSCLHLMKIAYPDGFEEPVIGSILKETLKALDYLHRQGQIHRDVKAGNILIDNAGIVKLGDFGVSACMFDRGDRQRSRNTFVGTPCWMAPEVLQPGTGYNFKADIWSFGITALELAHGHAPFSKYPPMKVLLMTLQNAPPGLDYDRDKRFSKSFKEMVAMCLVKDQTKRPTAEKLLKHSFFKNAKPPELTMKGILTDLPPLWDRVKALQLKDAAQLALKKMPSSEQEALSLSEYQRGVSAWNFDVEDLKAQASLIRDDEPPEIKEDDDTAARTIEVEKDLLSRNHLGKSSSANESVFSGRTPTNLANSDGKGDFAFEAFDFDDNNVDTKIMPNGYENSRSENNSSPSTSKQDPESKYWRSTSGQKQQISSSAAILSGGANSSTVEKGHGVERDATTQLASEKHRTETRRASNLSGPLSLPTRASANSLSAPIRSSGGYVDSLGDKSKRNVVEIKGRFSVTSENVDLAKVQEVPLSSLSRKSPQGSPLRKSASVGDWLVNTKPVSNSHHVKELCNSSVSSSILIPHLENLVKQTMFQQDLIMNVLSSLQQNEKVDGVLPGVSPQHRNMDSETMVGSVNSEKERSLLVKISELQSRMITLTDELIAAKLKHVQLQQELNALYCREEIEDIRDDNNEET